MNKQFILLMLSCISVFPALYGQSHGIGIHFGGNDFYGPQSGKYFTDNRYTVTNNAVAGNLDTSVKKALLWHPLVKVTYWRQLNDHFDLNAGLSAGNVDYPANGNDADFRNRWQYGVTKEVSILLSVDARMNYNILPKSTHVVSPYIFAGASLSYHPVFAGVNIPLGAGLNFKLSKNNDLYLNIESGYKKAITNTDQNHLQHSVGFVYWFKPYYKEAVITEEVPSPDGITGAQLKTRLPAYAPGLVKKTGMTASFPFHK